MDLSLQHKIGNKIITPSRYDNNTENRSLVYNSWLPRIVLVMFAMPTYIIFLYIIEKKAQTSIIGNVIRGCK